MLIKCPSLEQHITMSSFFVQDGDIVNIDVTVYHRGYHGDLNETFFVGNPKDSAKKLVKNTWDSLEQVNVRKNDCRGPTKDYFFEICVGMQTL